MLRTSAIFPKTLQINGWILLMDTIPTPSPDHHHRNDGARSASTQARNSPDWRVSFIYVEWELYVASMGLEYLHSPSKSIKCRQIYHTWIRMGIIFFGIRNGGMKKDTVDGSEIREKTTWDTQDPVNNGRFSVWSGAGILPSTAWRRLANAKTIPLNLRWLVWEMDNKLNVECMSNRKRYVLHCCPKFLDHIA